MKAITHFRQYALAALLVVFSTASFANQGDAGPTPEELAAQAAEAQHDAAVAGIASDRYGTIAGIVAIWEPSMGGDNWAEEFTAALNGATDAQLLDIQAAGDYDAVRAILQGHSVPVTLEGVTGTEDLGSLVDNLVYTPIFPCRIFDTRNFLAVPPANGATLSYQVRGNGPTMVAQGGNPAGCTAPGGEPVGVSINLAAVPTSPSGHLRIYPFGGALPTASFLNYFGGGNIANSGIVTSCFLCARDINVFHRNLTHAFADVMGYFYPARLAQNSVGQREINTADLDSGSQNVSALLVAGDNYILGATTTPNDTGKCLVNVGAQITSDSTDTNTTTYLRTARKVGAAAPTNDLDYGQYFQAYPQNARSSHVTAHSVWNVTAGSQQFGCYIRASGDLVGDTANCRVTWMCF